MVGTHSMAQYIMLIINTYRRTLKGADCDEEQVNKQITHGKITIVSYLSTSWSCMYCYSNYTLLGPMQSMIGW